ncbi:hypothetical protein [Streptomyces sp. NPDC058280]|uniref:hypothetical protein n=1 Tax=Streptomyces sp. NPDC058280 TaxID=3346419 RepID=UPI0036E04B0B
MSESYLETMVRRHAEQFVARHDGQHPYTACWPWAEASLSWSQANAEHLGYSLYRSYLQNGDAEHLVAGIAETLRLNMARHRRSVGDLNLDTARSELRYWTRHAGDYPEPGTPAWPEPTGPYTDQWRALFLSGDSDRAARVAWGANRVLYDLLVHTAKKRDRAAATTYRMDTRNATYVAVADAAPDIGITTPVEVHDPLAYQGIAGLTAVPEPSGDHVNGDPGESGLVQDLHPPNLA